MNCRLSASLLLTLLLILPALPTVAQENVAQKAGKKQEPVSAESHVRRYTGRRWQLVYGSYRSIEQFAVNELQRMVQSHIPYVIEVRQASEPLSPEANLILVGTAENNTFIAELGKLGLVKLPTKPQAYTMACLRSPWHAGQRVVAIAGADPSGVLYGVEDFNRTLANLYKGPIDVMTKRKSLDTISDFQVSEAPAIENRGLWSWGYVIYDYQRFFDNMARLKMNRIIIWNDQPPLNSRELITYAHARGIKVIFGFHWGWGIPHLDLANPEHRELVKHSVLCRYERDYRDLGLDGIYFQTLTEHSTTAEGQKSTATLACDWVNDIARYILEKYPTLRMEFGLHATSIREHYPDLRELDSRVTIVWEDAGVLLYSYNPEITLPERSPVSALATVDATIEYSKKLASFRPNNEFAMCAKGWTTLRWHTEFEDHGPFILGERLGAFKRARLAEVQSRWDYVDRQWVKYFPYAARFYREVRNSTQSPMTVVGLIEDGLLEEQIHVSAILLGEMLWNPNHPDAEIMERAMSPYYRSVQ